MPSGDEIPVTILTGFLGSGKTTLLNRLLRHPLLSNAMVIVNEFGEIAIDHDLIESSDEDTILLQNGCLCCTIRNDLIDTLQDIFRKRERGEITRFERVVIETTGLADPAPILQALMTDAEVSAHFRLDGIVTTVDAVVGQDTMDRHIEAVKQAAVADRLILTKPDLATEDRCSALEKRLLDLNPAALTQRAVRGTVDPATLFNIGLYDTETKNVNVKRWLDDEKYAASRHHHRHGHDVNRHGDKIRAICLVLDRPIPGDALDRWLQTLLRLKGPDLLRFKSIINVAELSGPLVVHGVQHVIYPPVMLPAWPSRDRRTRMVFITDGIDEQTIRRSLQEFTDISAEIVH
jgi:G3E family GTPase